MIYIIIVSIYTYSFLPNTDFLVVFSLSCSLFHLSVYGA